MKEEYWETKDGRKIAVGDMEEDHVRNVLRLILRRKRQFEEQDIDPFEYYVTGDDIY